jgi:hypothetical protein
MSVLVSDIINEAILDLAGIAPGESLTTAELNDAFARLNAMIASWSTEGLTVPYFSHTAFTITQGVSVYTLGTGGSLVTTARPMRVSGASSVSGNFRSAMKVVGFDQFAAEVGDPIASSTVLAKVLAADGSSPSINLRVFPVPATSPGTLWLDYWMELAQFATTGDSVTLPDEFVDALHFNLAVRLYPQYARAGGIPPELAANAQSTKQALVARNSAIQGLDQQAPPAPGGGA